MAKSAVVVSRLIRVKHLNHVNTINKSEAKMLDRSVVTPSFTYLPFNFTRLEITQATGLGEKPLINSFIKQIFVSCIRWTLRIFIENTLRASSYKRCPPKKFTFLVIWIYSSTAERARKKRRTCFEKFRKMTTLIWKILKKNFLSPIAYGYNICLKKSVVLCLQSDVKTNKTKNCPTQKLKGVQKIS